MLTHLKLKGFCQVNKNHEFEFLEDYFLLFTTCSKLQAIEVSFNAHYTHVI